MALSVWWVGSGDERTISRADWLANGITADPVTWSSANGWSIPHDVFSSDQLNLLGSDAEFVLGQDGLRIARPPGTVVGYSESAYIYYKRIKDLYEAIVLSGGGITIEQVQDAIDASVINFVITSDMTAAILAAKNELINGAPGTRDTLKELSDLLTADEGIAAAINAAVLLRALDSAVVHNTGTETIAGTKTFSTVPKSSQDAFASVDLVRKAQTDDIAAAAAVADGKAVTADGKAVTADGKAVTADGKAVAALAAAAAAQATADTKATDSAVVHNTATETIAGAKTFSTVPKSSEDASGTTDLVRKSQYDNGIGGRIPNTIIDAKGNILIGTADDTPDILAVGAVNNVLVPAPSLARGLAWIRARDINVAHPAYGAIGDGDSAKAAANTTAIQNALAASRSAGGGTVYVPGSVGAYCTNGITWPTDGYVNLEGDNPGNSNGAGAVTGSVLRNVHASNSSIKIQPAVPDTGTSNRQVGLKNIGLDCSAINTGQKGIDLNWAVKWNIDNVRVQNTDIGLENRLSWAGSYRNLQIGTCTTGVRFDTGSGGTSCPVVFENLTIYDVTNGIIGDEGLSGCAFLGGTIGNAVTGVQLLGFINIGIGFFGMYFENCTGDDVVLGDADSGPESVLFDNCTFQPWAAKTRHVVFNNGSQVTFDTCSFRLPFFSSGVQVTRAIEMGSGAGNVTIINPRMATIEHVKHHGTVHQIPVGTSVFNAHGFNGEGATISRIGHSVSSVPQVKVITSGGATPAINVDAVEELVITNQAADITSMSSGITGTPYNGQNLTYRITSGTVRAIAWGSRFAGPLPTATIVGQTYEITVTYDLAQDKYIYKNIGSLINWAAAKTAIVAADKFAVADSAAGFGVKGVSPSDIAAFVNAELQPLEKLATSMTTLPRNATGVITMTSNSIRFNYFTADKAMNVASITTITSTTAAGATPTLCRYGLYNVEANGDLTLLGATTADTTTWASASVSYTRSLTSLVPVVRNQRLAIGVLIVTAAATPTIQGLFFNADAFSQEPRLSAAATATGDLPASVLAANLSSTSGVLYCRAS